MPYTYSVHIFHATWIYLWEIFKILILILIYPYFLMFLSTVYRVYREPIILFHFPRTHANAMSSSFGHWCLVSCIPLRKLVFISRFTLSSLPSFQLYPTPLMESRPRHEGISFLSPDISPFWLPWFATVDDGEN